MATKKSPKSRRKSLKKTAVKPVKTLSVGASPIKTVIPAPGPSPAIQHMDWIE